MSARLELAEGLSEAIRSLLEEADRHGRDANRSSARNAYERALASLRAECTPELASSIIRWIGRSYLDDGDLDAAQDCFVAARAIAERQDDLGVIAHAVHCEALVHHIRGDLDEALERYSWARKRAQLVGDTKLEAMIHQNMGVISNIRGDLPSALEHYRKSLDGYRRLGLHGFVGPLRTNIGRLQTDLRMWDQAQASLGQAYDECVESGERTYQILVEVNRARLWTLRGSLSEAREACDAAYELSSRLSDDRWSAEIHKQYGVIHREMGKLQLALDHLLQARSIASARGDLVVMAETAAELGAVYRLQAKNHETLRYLIEAHRLFEELEARRELAHLAGRRERFEATFLDIVEQWGASIELQDPYTRGHCKRVTHFASLLAEADGIEPELLIWFRMGAFLHDVGKITIPPEVLNKTTPLTPEEWDILRSHPDAGAQLIADIEFPWDVDAMIRHHHERWDGGGYPHGLVGEDIPRSALILAIADAFDAMTSDRVYREALSTEEALEILRCKAGTHFNAELVELFCPIVRAEMAGTMGPYGEELSASA